jgi:predicted RNA-binding protein associated with RNAse of E/G family
MVIEQHIKMLELYYAHKHDAALKLCKELKNSGVLQQYYTDMLSRIRTSKIKHMEENTPNT